ncbi:MAG TPA: hypothetical protein VFO65_05390 [Acidimicrobiales bacterium]|nr:hypothetical protein [Acidimicrobiales bacterium]
MAGAEDDGWYWCVHHGRVEQGVTGCPPAERMGPYPTEEAARNWRQQVEERNDRWDAEDRAWSGEDE